MSLSARWFPASARSVLRMPSRGVWGRGVAHWSFPSQRPALGLRQKQGRGLIVGSLGLNSRFPPLRTLSTGPWCPDLRPYQVEALEACLAALDRGLVSIGLSLPTGSGKTYIFTHLIPKLLSRGPPEGQVLILVEKIDLAEQTARAVKAAHPHLTCEIEQGATHASGRADVTVAMVQILKEQGRLKKYDHAKLSGVIVDEAHHAAARTYRQILSNFNKGIHSGEECPLYTGAVAIGDPCVPIIGFSATFSRDDGLSLGSVFQEVVYHREVDKAVQEGWLSPIAVKCINHDLDATSASSATEEILQPDLESDKGLELVVQTYLKYASQRRSTLVFGASIAHVEQLTAVFQSHGLQAHGVSSQTTRAVRHRLVQDFKDGAYPILVNCELLTEGNDIPNVDCIVLARPVYSPNRMVQMVGRGLRLSPGKENCLVLDFGDNFERHGGLYTFALLHGLSIDPSEPKKARGPQDQDDDKLTQGIRDVKIWDFTDPFGLGRGNIMKELGRWSPNAWLPIGPRALRLEAAKHGQYVIKPTPPGTESDCYRRPYDHLMRQWEAGRLMGTTTTLLQALKLADRVVDIDLGRHGTLIRRSAPWRLDPASEKQIEWMRKNGLEPFEGENLTKGKVCSMMTAWTSGAAARAAVKEQRQSRETDVDKEEETDEQEGEQGEPVEKSGDGDEPPGPATEPVESGEQGQDISK